LHYDIHGKTFSAPSSAFNPWFIRSDSSNGPFLNLQQLQTARAALWHQTAAADPASRLLTLDDAARWLDDIGLCLFLPRHTQLPAPAPSFVEACLGAASVTPPPEAIAQASELATRLVAEGRAIPLNLLGAFSDQPDFLVTPEILPWVTAVHGDRQWKSAPAGRPTPVVMRAWEALEREGEKTVVELQAILGRELTEAAVLRALIALWTTLRAMPVYSPGGPVRWTLLKSRYSAQLATGANTAQTTALSALLSIYLRSAVAATAEEAEIFLSPLTARSRIREVVHGMMATRQVGTMSVASQTLLFVEGSLPETIPMAEEPEQRTVQPLRKEPRPTRWELPAIDAAAQSETSASGSARVPWQKKPAVPARPRPARDERGQRGQRPAASGAPFRAKERRPGAKPWQRSRSDDRPRFPPKRAGEKNEGPGKPRDKRDARGPSRWGAGDRQSRAARPAWKKAPAGRPAWKKGPTEPPAGREDSSRGKPPSGVGFKPGKSKFGERPRFSGSGKSAPGEPRDRPSGPSRPGKPFSPRPGSSRPEGRPGKPFSPRAGGGRPEGRPGKPFSPRPGSGRPEGRPGKPFSPRAGGGRPEGRSGKPFTPRPSGGRPEGRSGKPFTPRPSGGRAEGRPGKPFSPRPGGGRAEGRPGKPFSARPFSPRPGAAGRPEGRQSRPFRPAKKGNKFGNFTRRKQNPRKNRKQEENPE
jgi:hypothetical protein